jgi:hypothetical protein
MYIGMWGVLHHLYKEVVDNSIDEAMGGHCDSVDINEDGSLLLKIMVVVFQLEFIKRRVCTRGCND